MHKFPQNASVDEADIDYEVVDEFDELLEIDEIDDEFASEDVSSVARWAVDRNAD